MGQNKKVYISLPMGGQETTVKSRYENAVRDIKERFGEEYQIVAPIDIDEFDENGFQGERTHDWAYYIGLDVAEILRCDAIYMCKGYLLSPGCRMELVVARERDLRVLYAPDATEFLKTKSKCKETE